PAGCGLIRGGAAAVLRRRSSPAPPALVHRPCGGHRRSRLGDVPTARLPLPQVRNGLEAGAELRALSCGGRARSCAHAGELLVQARGNDSDPGDRRRVHQTSSPRAIGRSSNRSLVDGPHRSAVGKPGVRWQRSPALTVSARVYLTRGAASLRRWRGGSPQRCRAGAGGCRPLPPGPRSTPLSPQGVREGVAVLHGALQVRQHRPQRAVGCLPRE
ncbi:MAG: hypothetical protein K0Q72_2785, partial [Armatimonadetes bacterium]|nr:hypothetical protein [Armatimonadota bacterium]